MDDDVKTAIDAIANALQVISLLSTRLRQNLGESAQHAIDLEGATARAVPSLTSAGVRSPSRLASPARW